MYYPCMCVHLVLVWPQVYTVSPYIVTRVLCRLMGHIAEEILRVLRTVENFSHNGALHVSKDVYVTSLVQHVAITLSLSVIFGKSLLLQLPLCSGACRNHDSGGNSLPLYG